MKWRTQSIFFGFFSFMLLNTLEAIQNWKCKASEEFYIEWYKQIDMPSAKNVDRLNFPNKIVKSNILQISNILTFKR